MEIQPDRDDDDHFFIRPVNPVRPEIFRQVSTLEDPAKMWPMASSRPTTLEKTAFMG